ncbi:hypothetical protein CROQUDRAFT_667391 [Cronartium quercuum f. sp. fusiforme G11]|uniref:TFIID subunit TAF5 NTD2 domain-containing protein n=1 Tax=Cronartium quercuum f. sp. fusiforme G11 TaxID=708437 RepID=A0A9P6NYA5_9BASI|nr:hypothetical protein CROQUDRAFT_667391 [Cronartium quercuum f. sp. fusiforme G11]
MNNNNNNNNNNNSQNRMTNTTKLNNDQAILDYLTRRGFQKAEYALRAELATSSSSATSTSKGKTVGLDEFNEKNSNLIGSKKDYNNHNHLGRNLIKQPSEYSKGYEGLREFVNNSLDIHRPAFLPFLLPLFVHSYIDLVIDGRRESADDFLNRFSADHIASNPSLINELSRIRRPYHIQESEIIQRWRNERYLIKISERAKNLLMAWLQTDSLNGDSDESRAKDRMTSTINERVKVEYTNASMLSQFQSGLESEISNSNNNNNYNGNLQAGLESDFNLNHSNNENNQISNDYQLKLGPVPKDPKLMKEVERIISTEEKKSTEDNQDTIMTDGTLPNKSSDEPLNKNNLLEPTVNDLLPYPNNFRTLDLMREVELVREARKRIKLGPEAFNNGGSGSEKKLEVWKPSVCAFTIHDAGDTMTAARFSDDVTVLGAGFSDSSIKLWNLKGDPFEPIRDDGRPLDSSTTNEAETIKRMRKKTLTNSVKLIGHSGPVYSLSFDPIPGPSNPPRYLLSASQDSTIRLWSLDLLKNLVVYRGHRDPVWDVEWGPKGIYFASGSRDRTARLWCCERVGAVRMFVGHLSDVDCVTFHPNSLYLATGSSDRTCRLWDVQRGNCVRVFHGHEGAVNSIAISPDGKLLASAGEDQSIKIWDIGSSRLLKTMRGHQAPIYSLAFSAESSILASGGADECVRLWDVCKPGSEPLPRKLPPLSEGSIGHLRKGLLGIQEYPDTADLLATLATRRTPVLGTKFTARNLLLAVGPMMV